MLQPFERGQHFVSLGPITGNIVEVNPEGGVYTAHDGADEISKYNSSGQLEWSHSDRSVNDIAATPDGEVYLISHSNNEWVVQRLNSEGATASQFSIEADWTPKEIAYDDVSGAIYVAYQFWQDYDDIRTYIRRYGLNGSLFSEWSVVGSSCYGGDSSGYLRDLEVDSFGNVFVLLNPQHSQEACPNVVHVYDRNGGLVSRWGKKSTGGSLPHHEPGVFSWPHGIAVSPEGLVFVGDWSKNTVQVFTSFGEFVTMWGTSLPVEELDIGLSSGDIYVQEYYGHGELNVYR